MNQPKSSFINRLLYSCFILSVFFISTPSKLNAQACDCPYPVIFLHGFTGDYTSFQDFFTDPDFVNIWGSLSDIPDAVLNANNQTHAFGNDTTRGNLDDDMIAHVQFANRSALAPGCLYALDWDWFWNQDTNNPLIGPTSTYPTPSGESDSNQSAIEKQGFAVSETIKAVLAANPTKKKVILMGHSMGGLASREYLQRFENGQYTWWVDPTDPIDGHKVAKLISVGTPHRGSNLTGLGLGGLFGLDETSEAVRDLRYNYACGFLNLSRCRAPYLFGDREDPHVNDNYFKNGDVDCDGDYDTQTIVSLNLAGTSDPWDGTIDNPLMPLPMNVRYSYYVSNQNAGGLTTCAYQNYGCSGDGVVDDQRQWLYSGGQGRTQDFYDGTSIPVPNDGVPHRLTDRVTSENGPFHTDQPGDIEFGIRCMDEGDYPAFAHDINMGIDYAGISQRRADIVPADSEYSGGDNSIDGDWFVFETSMSHPGFDISITPNINKAGRIDFYDTAPSPYSNANSPTSSFTWSAGQTPFILSSTNTCFIPNTYYFRITHEGLGTNAWKDSYKFRVDPKPCNPPTALTASVTDLIANLSWTAVPCATQYTLEWRETGTTTWNTTTISGTTHTIDLLLTNTSYEYQVSTDCGTVGSSNFSTTTPFSTLPCQNTLYIPSVASTGEVTSGTYDVNVLITSDGFISSTATTEYFAGNCVELLPDFEVALGADFLADIRTCVPFAPSDHPEALASDILNVRPVKSTLDRKHQVSWQQHLKNNPRPFFRRIPMADGLVKLEYYLLKDSKVQILLLDDKQVIHRNIFVNDKEKSGLHQVIIDTKTLAPNIYPLIFEVDGQEILTKIVVRPRTESRRRN